MSTTTDSQQVLKCFICLEEVRDESASSNKNRCFTNSFTLQNILDLPNFNWEEHNLRTIDYCELCSNEINRIKMLMEDLERLERAVLDSKYGIELKLKKIPGEFINRDGCLEPLVDLRSQVVEDLKSSSLLEMLEKIKKNQVGKKPRQLPKAFHLMKKVNMKQCDEDFEEEDSRTNSDSEIRNYTPPDGNANTLPEILYPPYPRPTHFRANPNNNLRLGTINIGQSTLYKPINKEYTPLNRGLQTPSPKTLIDYHHSSSKLRDTQTKWGKFMSETESGSQGRARSSHHPPPPPLTPKNTSILKNNFYPHAPPLIMFNKNSILKRNIHPQPSSTSSVYTLPEPRKRMEMEYEEDEDVKVHHEYSHFPSSNILEIEPSPDQLQYHDESQQDEEFQVDCKPRISDEEDEVQEIEVVPDIPIGYWNDNDGDEGDGDSNEWQDGSYSNQPHSSVSMSFSPSQQQPQLDSYDLQKLRLRMKGKGVKTECSNCGTNKTTMWRKDNDGMTVCNACGLYFKVRGVKRPVIMKNFPIKTRNRKEKKMPRQFTRINLEFPHGQGVRSEVVSTQVTGGGGSPNSNNSRGSVISYQNFGNNNTFSNSTSNPTPLSFGEYAQLANLNILPRNSSGSRNSVNKSEVP